MITNELNIFVPTIEEYKNTNYLPLVEWSNNNNVFKDSELLVIRVGEIYKIIVSRCEYGFIVRVYNNFKHEQPEKAVFTKLSTLQLPELN